MGNAHGAVEASNKPEDELKRLAQSMYRGLRTSGKIITKTTGKPDEHSYPNSAVSKDMTMWMQQNVGQIQGYSVAAVLRQMVHAGIVFRLFKDGNTHHTKDPLHNGAFKSSHKTFYQFNMAKIATHKLSIDILRARNIKVITDGNRASSISVRLNVDGQLQCKTASIKDPSEAPEWNEQLRMPEWNASLNKDEAKPWIYLVDLDGIAEVEIVSIWAKSSKKRISMTSIPRSTSQETDILKIQLDIHSPEESIESAPVGNAMWHFEDRTTEHIPSTFTSDELEQSEDGVEMGPLLANNKPWKSYTGSAPALQMRYKVDVILDESLDSRGGSNENGGFLRHLKSDITHLANLLKEKMLHPSVKPWTIQARILEIESLHINTTGSLFAELSSNGFHSREPAPIDDFVHGPEQVPKFGNCELEIRSVPANLSTDEVDLVIFQEVKASLSKRAAHRSWALNDHMILSSATIVLDDFDLNPFQRRPCVNERYEGDPEPKAQWVKLYTKQQDGHMVYNGRVKIAIWRFHAETGMRKRKFWLLSVIASKTSCIILLLVCFHQFGMLYFLLFYPFRALLWIILALPMLFFFPTLMGLFLSIIVTKAGTFGFPITFGSLWLVPWIRNGSFHLRVNVEDFAFSNPPRFPRKDFLHVKHASIHFRFPMTLFSLDTIRYALQYKWSPFPSECAKLTNYRPDKDPHAHKALPQEKVGVLGIEHFEVNGVILVFEMFQRHFNINEVVRLLAEGKAFGQGWPENDAFGFPSLKDDCEDQEKSRVDHQELKRPPANWTGIEPDPLVYPPHADPSGKLRPNCLIVQVVEGRNIDVECKTLDPMVSVAVRHQKAKTAALLRGTDALPDPHNPRWGGVENTFRFHVTDPSAVLHITVFDEDATRYRFVGQFVYTMKFFRVKPDYSWHCEDEFKINAEDRTGEGGFQIEGWFKLADSNFLNHGDPQLFPPGHATSPNRINPEGTNPKGPGCLRLKMSWLYDKRFDKTTAEGRDVRIKNGQALLEPLSMINEPPDLTALEQLQLNSAETQLRLGNQLLVKHMLETFPLLLDVKRCTIRDVRFSLGDLFRGYGSEKVDSQFKASEAQAIYIDCIEVVHALKPSKKELKHRARDSHCGLSLWRFLFCLFVKGIAPKVGSNVSVLAQGSASILTSGAGGIISLLKHATLQPTSRRHNHLHEHGKQNSMMDHIMLAMSSVDRKCADSAAIAAVNRNEDKSRAMSQKFRGDKKAWRVSQIHSNEDMQKMMTNEKDDQ